MCWQIVEDRLWSFPNACVWISWRWGNYGSRIGYHGNILLSTENQWEGGEAETKSLICREGGGETETENVILWHVVLEWLAGGWWLPVL